MYKDIPVIIVVAMSRNGHAIGRENGLLWHIPEDMKRFRRLTTGHPLIMGRKTFESILEIVGRPLPDRHNIVVTRNPDYQHDGVDVVTSLEAAFEKALEYNPSEIHIGGGSQLYEQALPYTDKLWLTFVDDEPESDAFFPDFEEQFTEEKSYGVQKYNDLTYEWVDFIRPASSSL